MLRVLNIPSPIGYGRQSMERKSFARIQNHSAKEAFMPSRRLRDSAKTFPQPERIEVLTK